MNKLLTNPYLAVLLVPLVGFLLLIAFNVNPDLINLTSRLYVFVALGYIGARYVGRSPYLIIEQNWTPEARNVVGWSICVLGLMAQIGYGWIYIAADRPEWLSSQYLGGSIIVLVGTGLTLVASSVPRFPPFSGHNNGLSVGSSFIIAGLSALGLMLATHVPQIFAGVGRIMGRLF